MSYLYNKENGILFEAYYQTIKAGMIEFDLEVYAHSFLRDYLAFRGDEEKAKRNFSHDNMTALCCILPHMRSFFPLFGYHSLHPCRFAFYLWFKYPILGLPFLWLWSLHAIWGCFSVYRKNSVGKEYIDTDGKLITWLICQHFNMPITFKICTYLINKKIGSWKKTFMIYFWNEITYRDIRNELEKNDIG